MRTYTMLMLTAVTSAAIGAVAVEVLHAQATPPAFVVADIDVTNQEGYMKEFVPPVTKSITDSGGVFLARGGKTLAIEGDPPKNRVVINQFPSLEKVQAWANSAAYKEAAAIGRKYGKLHVYAVEGVSP